MIVWLTPSMVDGLPIGSWTLRSVWRRVEPNELATSRAVGGTPRIPRLVSRTAGGSANINVEMMAVAAPIPKSSTSGKRYANAGTVCIASSSGRRAFSARSFLPAQIPSGMPIKSPAPTDTMMSASVSMLDSQRPSSPINENPAAATIAIRHPAKIAARAAAATMTPRYVIRFKTVMHPVEQLLRDVLDRGEDEREQRARRLVLDHPVLEAVEDLPDVHDQLLREAGVELKPDREHHDHGRRPDQPPAPWRRRHVVDRCRRSFDIFVGELDFAAACPTWPSAGVLQHRSQHGRPIDHTDRRITFDHTQREIGVHDERQELLDHRVGRDVTRVRLAVAGGDRAP